MINHKQRSKKLRENSKILQKLTHAFQIKTKEKNMILEELMLMDKEVLIWAKDSQDLAIWEEWEEKEEHLNFHQIWEELEELILMRYLECSSNKMEEWEDSTLALVDLVQEESQEIQEEWVLMAHKVMQNLMILEDSEVLEALEIWAIWEVIWEATWEDLEILVGSLAALETNLVTLVLISEKLIKELATLTQIRNDLIYFNIIILYYILFNYYKIQIY